MNNASAARILVLGLLICLCPAALSACGKDGDPKPRQSTRSFVWQEVNITPIANCLEVRAVMSGVYNNLESVILEMDAVNGPEDCPGCPFSPGETYTQEKNSKVFDPNRGALHFTYCPRQKGAAYRARIVGVNVFDTSRHAVSAEHMVIMP
jgi:hypothetical protein